VYLDDVAEVVAGPDQPERYVRFGTGAGATGLGLPAGIDAPAVTLAIAKKPGTNAVVIAADLVERLAALDGVLIPEGVHATITRNYGVTANDKATTLIGKLIFATSAVVLLVLLTLGWREAVVVGAAVVITLAVTLFASWAWGFTINRVSLFALIFSIGILVDDAIVVVENVHRHMAMGAKSLRDAIPGAVDEVGGPTILATFTVIAALLPMAFVTGLMGPYMSPIPINASAGMLLSLAVALVVTPWLALKLLTKHAPAHEARPAALEPLFQRIVGPFLGGPGGKRARHRLYGGVGLALVLAVSLGAVKLVGLKMLPFDNKSELQWSSTCPKARPSNARRACSTPSPSTSARCPRSTIIKPTRAPRRRSTSTVSCGSTTCARAPTSATFRSTSSTRRIASDRATTLLAACANPWWRSAAPTAPP
jgi:multidrug efflux pump subunit AcrB